MVPFARITTGANCLLVINVGCRTVLTSLGGAVPKSIITATTTTTTTSPVGVGVGVGVSGDERERKEAM